MEIIKFIENNPVFASTIITPAVTVILGLLVTFIKRKFFDKKLLEDIKLGKLFLEQFPSNGNSCLFLRDHDLQNAFHDSKLKELENFVFNWDNAEHDFLNSKLEKIKKLLINEAKNFLNVLSEITGMHHELSDFITTGFPRPDLVSVETKTNRNMVIKKLNQSATNVFKLHEELVLKIRQKLNI